MNKKSETEKRTELAAVWPPNEKVALLAGHKTMTPLKAIRLWCLDCSYDQPSEVRLCVRIGCPLWPFRSGKHPYTSNRAQQLKTSPSECDSRMNAHEEGVALQCGGQRKKTSR